MLISTSQLVRWHTFGVPPPVQLVREEVVAELGVVVGDDSHVLVGGPGELLFGHVRDSQPGHPAREGTPVIPR